MVAANLAVVSVPLAVSGVAASKAATLHGRKEVRDGLPVWSDGRGSGVAGRTSASRSADRINDHGIGVRVVDGLIAHVELTLRDLLD